MKLKISARYGSLEYSETAYQYNKNAHDEQVDDCLRSIRRQIADAGQAEMMDAFLLTSEIIE